MEKVVCPKCKKPLYSSSFIRAFDEADGIICPNCGFRFIVNRDMVFPVGGIKKGLIDYPFIRN